MLTLDETLKERGETHGNYEQQMELAGLICGYLATPLAHKSYVANHTMTMLVTKLTRIVCGKWDEIDHWRDIQGYAAKMVEFLESKNITEKQDGPSKN